MPSLINRPVLVVDCGGDPVQVTIVRNALKLIVKGAAVTVEALDREIRPSFPVPSVIRLVNHYYIPHRNQEVSRKNIYLRDRFQCQYCYKKFHSSDLTLDHILPQSRGGRSRYENLCACCRPCNRRKANMTPEEAGMVLLHKYKPINIHSSKFTMRAMGEDDPHWRKYLYFENVTSQQD